MATVSIESIARSQHTHDASGRLAQIWTNREKARCALSWLQRAPFVLSNGRPVPDSASPRSPLTRVTFPPAPRKRVFPVPPGTGRSVKQDEASLGGGYLGPAEESGTQISFLLGGGGGWACLEQVILSEAVIRR